LGIIFGLMIVSLARIYGIDKLLPSRASLVPNMVKS
jgi:hypothetical protein